MDNLHSRKDDEMEERDRKSFAQVVLLASIAVAILFAVGLLVIWVGGRYIPGLNATSHLTSVVLPGPGGV